MAICKSDCLDCANSCKVQGFWVCSIHNLIIELIEFDGDCPNFKYEWEDEE